MKLLLSQLRRAQAATLARNGAFRPAEDLLQPAGEEPRDVATLDLLARMRAQQGDYLAAEKWWVQVLRLDPNHSGAQAGIRRLHRTRTGPSCSSILAVCTGLAMLLVTAYSYRALARVEQSRHDSLASDLAKRYATNGAALADLMHQVESLAATQTRGMEDSRDLVGKKLAEAAHTLRQESAAQSLSTSERIEKVSANQAVLMSSISELVAASKLLQTSVSGQVSRLDAVVKSSQSQKIQFNQWVDQLVVGFKSNESAAKELANAHELTAKRVESKLAEIQNALSVLDAAARIQPVAPPLSLPPLTPGSQ